MAEELGISPHTIRDHLKHLYRKTGTNGRNELLGLISRAS
jgi:DNA-binding CsgD family transcriptional regulator